MNSKNGDIQSGTTVTSELNIIQILLQSNTYGILESIMKMYAHLNTKNCPQIISKLLWNCQQKF